MEGTLKFSTRREPGQKFIVKPVTEDGLVGYDQFDQFAVTQVLPDGTQSSHHIADVRGRTCVMCERGWEPTGPSMADQLKWTISESFVHLSCFVRHGALVQRELFWTALVNSAEVRFHGFEPIANNYWPSSDPWAKQPWYQAFLMDHQAKFILGRRKNVYHVEVVPLDGTRLGFHVQAAKAFEAENVTKEFSSVSVMLHAWSSDKLREYVKKIAKVAGYRHDAAKQGD